MSAAEVKCKMPIEKMKRMASDNEYLHRDFHIALNNGLIYLEEKYGRDAVVEYLEDFSNTYYRPLKDSLIKTGLSALKEYFERIYAAEKSSVKTSCSSDELFVEIEKCPAVEYMRTNNVKPSPAYSETSDTVYRTICKDTPFDFELVEYDNETGRSKMKFYRRSGS
jgi:hypothetical protein